MIRQQFDKLNKRTLIFLSIAAVLLIVIICDRLSFSPFNSTSGNMNDELALKKKLFTKYKIAINNRGIYETKLTKLKEIYNSYEKKIIQSETEDLAQAKLQDYVKGIARKSGLIISRSSAQKVEIINEEPHLMLVYARVEINNIDIIKKLQKFLYNIEYSNKTLVFVDDLKIKSTGFTKAKGVSATIKLSAIAKIEAKGSGKKVGLQSAFGHHNRRIMLADKGRLDSI